MELFRQRGVFSAAPGPLDSGPGTHGLLVTACAKMNAERRTCELTDVEILELEVSAHEKLALAHQQMVAALQFHFMVRRRLKSGTTLGAAPTPTGTIPAASMPAASTGMDDEFNEVELPGEESVPYCGEADGEHPLNFGVASSRRESRRRRRQMMTAEAEPATKANSIAVKASRDSVGEERVRLLANGITSSAKFCDTTFPAVEATLYKDGRPGRFGTVQWLRPEEFGDVRQKAQSFVNACDPGDINQGALGDCYFLAALANCAMERDLIEDLIVEDFAQTGLYGVKIFRYGTWETVVVDDLVPCKLSDASKTWEPLFAKSSKEGKEMWTIIAEKAWAKVNGSYTAIEGGIAEDMLVYLTGGASISINMDSPSVVSNPAAASQLWERLAAARPERSADGRKFFMCAGGVRDKKVAGNTDPTKLHSTSAGGGLVSDHAYSLLEVIEIGSLKLMKLRNPVRSPASAEARHQQSLPSPAWRHSASVIRFEFGDCRAHTQGPHASLRPHTPASKPTRRTQCAHRRTQAVRRGA